MIEAKMLAALKPILKAAQLEATAPLAKEIVQLRRKLKTSREQRDRWHEAAQRYQRAVIELKRK